MMYPADTVMKRILAHRSDPIPSLHDVRPDVPAWLEPIFQKMVAKDRRDRYQSMLELLVTVAPHVASGLASSETDVSVPGQRSGSEGSAGPRPVAPLLVRLPESIPAAPKYAPEKTAPTTDGDTALDAVRAGPPVPAAKPAPPRGDPTRGDALRSDPARSEPVRNDPIAGQETGAPAELVSWRMPRGAREATSRPGMIPVATFRKRRRMLVAVAVYVGLLLLVALVAGNYFSTADGTIVIEAADQDVDAALTDNGIRLLDVATGQAFTLRPGRHDLKFGDYEVDVAELPSGIEISTRKFRLQRGDTETLRITLARKDD
jgi:hypothetical protein